MVISGSFTKAFRVSEIGFSVSKTRAHLRECGVGGVSAGRRVLHPGCALALRATCLFQNAPVEVTELVVVLVVGAENLLQSAIFALHWGSMKLPAKSIAVGFQFREEELVDLVRADEEFLEGVKA